MKKVMKKIWILTLLTIVSQVGSAQIVDLNDSYVGGTIQVAGISEPAEDGSVVATITVSPYTGYYIAKSDIQGLTGGNISGNLQVQLTDFLL